VDDAGGVDLEIAVRAGVRRDRAAPACAAVAGGAHAHALGDIAEVRDVHDLALAAAAADIGTDSAPRRAPPPCTTPRCTEDIEEARTLYERAMGLAPKTWIKAAASDHLYGGSS
jgi:hypothetical protein